MPRSLPASIANSRFFGIGEISELVLCRTRPFYLFTSHRQNTFRSRLRHIPCTASYCLIIFPGNRRIFQEVSFKKYETFNAIQTERHYARVRKQPRPCRADAGPRASYPNGSSRRRTNRRAATSPGTCRHGHHRLQKRFSQLRRQPRVRILSSPHVLQVLWPFREA